MFSLGGEVVAAARSRVGAPFLHHFRPENTCQGGTTTIEKCMQRGMDDRGYDCSGLVIASICDVLGLKPSQWPKDYRHLNQLKDLGKKQPAEAGDILIFDPARSSRYHHGAHMGIFVMRHCVIHASGISKVVEGGEVEGNFQKIKVIPAAVLASLITAEI